MTRVSVHGAAGRMGRSIVNVLVEDKGATLVSAIERGGHAALGQMSRGSQLRRAGGIALTSSLEPRSRVPRCERLLTTRASAPSRWPRCERRGAAVVFTTGFVSAVARALECAVQGGPVVVAPNTARRQVLALAAQRTLARSDYDIEIARCTPAQGRAPSHRGALDRGVAPARGSTPRAVRPGARATRRANSGDIGTRCAV